MFFERMRDSNFIQNADFCINKYLLIVYALHGKKYMDSQAKYMSFWTFHSYVIVR